MKATGIIIIIVVAITILASFTRSGHENLRKIYSGDPQTWPVPSVDPSVNWKELGVVPAGPLANPSGAQKKLIELGKALFFDNRLSSSGKISCASCHRPELSWTDGKARSEGHEGAMNKRNSPSLQNVWFYDSLFWDGRSHSLEDQAFAPINSESEMHSDMRTLPRQLSEIRGYKTLFKDAFGDDHIEPDRITEALAAFQRTITSGRTSFDEFLSGKSDALSNAELRGLHIFRTKARCMNCHHGSLFTDDKFHNNGFAGNDPGRYNVTHKDADLGKFKTPGLRSVTLTGPWMHAGNETSLQDIINRYDKPATGAADGLIKPLHLSRKEKRDLLAFLHAISVAPQPFIKPLLPQ